MKRSFRRNLKAVSPVIATIIIVAIAIVMSIAVAYWMLGLGAAFTRYEKLEIISAYALKGEPVNSTEKIYNFTVRLKLRNGGSAPLTIDEVFFNGIPSVDVKVINEAGDEVVGCNVAALLGITLNPGDETGTLDIYYAGKSGMSLEVLIRTVAGKDYPKVVILP